MGKAACALHRGWLWAEVATWCSRTQPAPSNYPTAPTHPTHLTPVLAPPPTYTPLHTHMPPPRPPSFLWHPQGVLVRNFVSHPGTLEPGTRAWKESVTQYRSFASGRVREGGRGQGDPGQARSAGSTVCMCSECLPAPLAARKGGGGEGGRGQTGRGGGGERVRHAPSRQQTAAGRCFAGATPHTQQPNACVCMCVLKGASCCVCVCVHCCCAALLPVCPADT